MSEPGREGRLLALIEAEFRADDPGLIELFDAFGRRSPALGAPRDRAAGQQHGEALARRLLAVVLVLLTAMTVLAVLSGALAPLAHARSDVAGLERRTVTAVDMWAVREGRAVRARMCRSVPLPAAAACQ